MSKLETKTCQNCKIKFRIDPEDFEFYKKIDVPTPTWCPECRLVRRLTFRNIRNLYKRKCDLTGKNILALYAPDRPFPVYEQNAWNSDKWDPLEYGLEVDFSKPFLEQFKKLQTKVPLPNLTAFNVVDSDYCSSVADVKKSYLLFNAFSVENSRYSGQIYHSKDCMDCDRVTKCELCYECFYCEGCYQSFFLDNCRNCMNTALCYDCRNCSNCFGCTGLRNKQYHIFNQSYSKEEYVKKTEELDTGSLIRLERNRKIHQGIKNKTIRKFADVVKSINCTGDWIRQSKGCHYCFDIQKCENLRYSAFVDEGLRDSLDTSFVLDQELSYESISVGINGYKTFFSSVVWSGRDIEYSLNCRGSNNIFGCIGLKSNQYCILNKQYTKEEYESLVPKIKEHMNEMPYVDRKKRVYKYGEFFPIELSPFKYNETLAHEYFPLNKEQAVKKGYEWYNKPKSEYKPTIKAKDLPDHIKNVDKSILKEVIECSNSGSNCAGSNVFRIIPQELEFYKKMNLPLPRFCSECRHLKRMRQQNSLKLWQRKCMCAGKQDDTKTHTNQTEHNHHKNKHCPNTFQTTYEPKRKEIVYCEKCYNEEVN